MPQNKNLHYGRNLLYYSVMRHFIVKILVVMLLFGSVAQAADSHAEVFFGHDSLFSQNASSQSDNDTHSSGIPDNGMCYHCCHAHNLGLPVELLAMMHDSTHQNIILPVIRLSSHNQDPPTQPPKS